MVASFRTYTSARAHCTACGHTPISMPDGGVVVLHKHVVLLCSLEYHFILTYDVSVSQLASLASYVHKYAPIIMYCLGLQCLQYDVARWVSKPHKSAKFHGLILFSSEERQC